MAVQTRRELVAGVDVTPRSQARIVDELLYMFRTTDAKIDSKTGHKRSKYERRAEFILYRINLYKPAPVFEIYENEIPEDLRAELDELDEDSLDDIMVETIYRLLDLLNVSKFKIDVPRRSIRWEFKEGDE